MDVGVVGPFGFGGEGRTRVFVGEAEWEDDLSISFDDIRRHWCRLVEVSSLWFGKSDGGES